MRIWIIKTKKNYHKNAYMYFEVITMSLAIVMMWRGVWNLLDYYVFPEYQFLSNLFTIIIWLSLLFLNDFDVREFSSKKK